MAERIQVELVDDIDGSPAQHTVTFALDGVNYEIDLSEHHAKQLRSVFAQYIQHARKPERSSARDAKRQEREERRVRQANRELTEEIRGAAQRTRERLREKEATAPVDPTDDVASAEHEDEDLFTTTVAGTAASEKSEPAEKVPAVSLPQFSSAVE